MVRDNSLIVYYTKNMNAKYNEWHGVNQIKKGKSIMDCSSFYLGNI